MTDALSSKAFLDLFLSWAAEFEAANRFYAARSGGLPTSVAPDDYDWSAATATSERLLAHVPTSPPEAICLMEVLIDHLDDKAGLATPLRALQSFLAQGVLGEIVGAAPAPSVVAYASEAA